MVAKLETSNGVLIVAMRGLRMDPAGGDSVDFCSMHDERETIYFDFFIPEGFPSEVVPREGFEPTLTSS